MYLPIADLKKARHVGVPDHWEDKRSTHLDIFSGSLGIHSRQRLFHQQQEIHFSHIGWHIAANLSLASGQTSYSIHTSHLRNQVQKQKGDLEEYKQCRLS